MKKILKEIVTDNSNTSSGRVINVGGFIVGTILLSYQTYQTGLTYDLFGVYMAYCSGTYGVSKYMDRKYGKGNRYGDTDVDNERYQEYSNHGTSRGIDNPDI